MSVSHSLGDEPLYLASFYMVYHSPVLHQQPAEFLSNQFVQIQLYVEQLTVVFEAEAKVFDRGSQRKRLRITE